MRFVQERQKVQLTKDAAERYGMDPNQIFTVFGTKPKPGYKSFYVILAELTAPLNVVKPSDLRPAKAIAQAKGESNG